MGRHCAAIGCTNSDEKNKKLSLGLTFHSFPLKRPGVLKSWVHAVKRKNFTPTTCSFLCSEHFKEGDFQLQPFTAQRQVKQDAVPSIFSFTPPPKVRRRTSYEIGANVSIAEDAGPSHKEECIQTSLKSEDVTSLENQVQELEAENKALKDKLERGPCSVLSQKDSSFRDLCGFSKDVFFVIFSFFCFQTELPSKTKKCKLVLEDQVFLTLIKSRQGFTDRVLSVLFDLKLCSVQNIFKKCLNVMYQKSKATSINWPSKEQVQAYMPPIFQKNFPACRVIIDATEFYVQKPGNPTQQQASFSSYQNNNTLKALIDIAPSGAISFISDLWLGSISDQDLTHRCKLLEKLEPGDTVLADRGFTSLQCEFEKIGVTLSTPTFLRDKIQFEVEERGENKRVSSHRCHVERAIGKLKRFKILDKLVPINMKNFEEIYYVCAFLSNFSEPLINCGTTGKKNE